MIITGFEPMNRWPGCFVALPAFSFLGRQTDLKEVVLVIKRCLIDEQMVDKQTDLI